MQKNKEKPIKISVSDFFSLLKEYGYCFEESMLALKAEQRTFPEWYEMFGRWNEVGTTDEELYHGSRSIDLDSLNHKKDCFWFNDLHTCDCGLVPLEIREE